ncbi:hypothetical protein FDP41_003829 [Naegleria fowleri]|uniref:Uncharacterized protein n=1 Tax=Naegleria fowleri TaxID=5763 RepID=A0A6A5BQ59_NAEFO|nr:uncharacterized protein FDP41_003829 [Naegleria fowleri]KAF0977176.1 hypothetical protein FDP41_003829 [Naegleria fowleri]
MLPSRSSTFLLSIAAFLLILLACNAITSFIHAEFLVVETFQGLSCSTKPVHKKYTPFSYCQMLISICEIDLNYLFSTNASCTSTMPLSPKVGEFMTLEYPDSKCSENPSSVTVTALDTCIPSNNCSYMYKGCQSKVNYSDQNCQSEVRTSPISTMNCDHGATVLCNSNRSSSGYPRNISDGATELMLKSIIAIVVSVTVVMIFTFDSNL